MTSPNDLPPLVEDYESLGHTFLGGQGSRENVTTARVVEVIEYERKPVDWTRLIWWAIGVAVIALCLLVAGVILAIIHHVHGHHAATGPSKDSGQVFAYLVVIVAVFLAVRGAARYFRGE